MKLECIKSNPLTRIVTLLMAKDASTFPKSGNDRISLCADSCETDEGNTSSSF
jgi:hypothetical protein